MGIKVLFIYPNTFGMNMLPPAIATFAAILKKEGHQVQVFDTTYYSTDHGNNSDGTKEEGLNVVPFSEQMKKRGMESERSARHTLMACTLSATFFLRTSDCKHLRTFNHALHG